MEAYLLRAKELLLSYGSALVAFHGYQPANMIVNTFNTLNVALPMHKNINNIWADVFNVMILHRLDCVQWSLTVWYLFLMGYSSLSEPFQFSIIILMLEQ